MNQVKTGNFIAQKRKQKNYTQEQLAQRLGVSNKTISKWENGKCMPDYSIIKQLCETLEITITELMDGEHNTIQSYNEQRIVDMLMRVQNLEKQKNFILGVMLTIMGISFYTLSNVIEGSPFLDFISGVFLGLSSGITLIGVFIVARTIVYIIPTEHS